ncbi:MFS transporter [Acidisphaera sp. S103]|uniref:MFS transporter n=1 Tax=Acidisphaera sp. S103 TaxID=1747223 RepID=UPI00131C2DC1|nr:MFS transporter [Acidisphaera sp. S103]
MARMFFGWKVVSAAFIVAIFTWGIGFYGPPIFLNAIHQNRGWSIPLISAAFTCNLLIGAVVMTNLAWLHARFGVAAVTRAGAVLTALGLVGWALAAEPWQLFAITPISASGWAMTSGPALNAMVAPWFDRRRPAALSMAYNGASFGGIVFSPLWVALIGHFGFLEAMALVGGAMVAIVWWLAGHYFVPTPEEMGLRVDDGPSVATPVRRVSAASQPIGPAGPWRDRRLLTQAAAAALSLFAQVGLMMQLFSLLVPALGQGAAGVVLGFAPAAALAGRSITARLMRPGINRRLVGMANSIVQIVGSVALLLAAGRNVPLLVTGSLLFGLGIGTTASMPPLIAQGEFTPSDLPRAVALVMGISQGCFAFAPLAFGTLRITGSDGHAPLVFAASAALQMAAVVALWLGMPRAAVGLAEDLS